MRSGKLQSKDEREKELNNMKKLIIKEKIKRQKDMRAMFSPDNFKTHKSNFLSMILYILYLLLFIIIIMMQADKKMLYMMQTADKKKKYLSDWNIENAI